MRLRGRAGFTLVEFLVTSAITALVIAGIVGLCIIGTQGSQPRSYTYTSAFGTFDYEMAPSAMEFRRASICMIQVMAQVDGASSVFVLGGYRSTPQASAVGGMSAPLSAGVLIGTVTGISTVSLPQTSYDLRTVLAGQSGVAFEATYGASDFTVLTISGLNTVTSITQVRRYTATIAGEAMVFYEVVCDVNPGVARDAVDGSATQNRFSYHVALSAAEDSNWTLAPGALHFWFRYDSTWDRREEAPARAVFPDPFLLGGDQPAADTAPFSRFILFLSPTA